MRLTVRVTPNASRSEIVSRDGEAWKVRLAAPPVDGKANAALIELLAKELGRRKSQIRIVRGQSSKTKVVEIED